MKPIASQRLTIFGPVKFGNGVTLDGGCDPKFLAFINSDIAQRSAKGWFGLVHSFLHTGLDSNISIRPASKSNDKNKKCTLNFFLLYLCVFFALSPNNAVSHQMAISYNMKWVYKASQKNESSLLHSTVHYLMRFEPN